MKKRIISVITVLCLGLIISAFNQNASAAAGLDNFTSDKAAYTSGQFLDVNENAWYGAANQGIIKKVIELGIMSGTGSHKFEPAANITIAQAIKMASVVHSIYSGGGGVFKQGNPWYQVYVDYAVQNGIIKSTDFSDYNADITRAQLAYVFRHAVPQNALSALNRVDSLPDVSANSLYSDDILLLYRAGVLTGNDEFGTYAPNAKAQRCQAAVIIVRIATESERKTFDLKPAVTKTSADKALVYDQYANVGKYTDDVDNTYNYSYHVPAFNLDSADATAANTEISSYLMKYINEELANMRQGNSLVLTDVSYQSYENGNCLSVVISLNLDWGFAEYKVYNINKYTGKLIGNSELLDYKNVSEDLYLKTAKNDMGAKYEEMYSGAKGSSDYKAQYNKTISSNNVSMNMPMFLDKDGTLNIIATIYSLAGADSYDYIIDTGL